MPPKICCCNNCEGVTLLFNTGQEISTPSGCSQADGIDLHWTANGGPAYAFFLGDGVSFEDDPTNGLGCEGAPRAITAVCANDIADKAIIEPGGPDGVEILYETTFHIAEWVDLDAIAFCGQFSADNYVKAGEWKVNGCDQAHIEHGSYFSSATLGCLDFAFTRETAQLRHGVNTIAITTKNGAFGSEPENRGGPTYLQLRISCVPRFPCSGVCMTWIADLAGETLVWLRQGGAPTCDCYCKCIDEPPVAPTFDGEVYTAYCEELDPLCESYGLARSSKPKPFKLIELTELPEIEIGYA